MSLQHNQMIYFVIQYLESYETSEIYYNNYLGLNLATTINNYLDSRLDQFFFIVIFYECLTESEINVL